MPIALTHAIRAVELVLRLAYFALAPAGLVLLATLFPIAGVVANIGFAVAVFAFASVLVGGSRGSRCSDWSLERS